MHLCRYIAMTLYPFKCRSVNPFKPFLSIYIFLPKGRKSTSFPCLFRFHIYPGLEGMIALKWLSSPYSLVNHGSIPASHGASHCLSCRQFHSQTVGIETDLWLAFPYQSVYRSLGGPGCCFLNYMSLSFIRGDAHHESLCNISQTQQPACRTFLLWLYFSSSWWKFTITATLFIFILQNLSVILQ